MSLSNNWKILASGGAAMAMGLFLLNAANEKTQISGAANPYTNQQVVYQIEPSNKGLLQIAGLILCTGSVGGTIWNWKTKEETQHSLPPSSLPVISQSVHNPVNQYNHQHNYGVPTTEQPKPETIIPRQSIAEPIIFNTAESTSLSYSVDDIWSNDGFSSKAETPKETTIPLDIEYQHKHPTFEATYPKINLTKQLTLNDLSFALSGVPGAGKSTLLLAWLAGIIKADKNTQVFIVGTKADSWLGLAEVPGVFKRFYRNTENVLIPDGFFHQVNIVNRILHERLGLPQKQRKGLHKVWLLLDDYFSISNTLDNCTDKETKSKWENAKAQLGEIITTGRECGVAMCVATQSLNIKSLGLADANIRGCLGLCALGRIYTDSNGRKEGGYSTITIILKNSYIISAEYTEEISNQFNKLKPISEKTGRAIALTTCGEPEIGLFEEDLSWVEDYIIPIKKTEVLPKKEDTIREPGALEFLQELAKKNGFSEIPTDEEI